MRSNGLHHPAVGRDVDLGNHVPVGVELGFVVGIVEPVHPQDLGAFVKSVLSDASSEIHAEAGNPVRVEILLQASLVRLPLRFLLLVKLPPLPVVFLNLLVDFFDDLIPVLFLLARSRRDSSGLMTSPDL